MPGFPIIDTHVHFWDNDAVPISWQKGLPIDRPFRPGPWKTGVLARNDSPEYLDAWRRRAARREEA